MIAIQLNSMKNYGKTRLTLFRLRRGFFHYTNTSERRDYQTEITLTFLFHVRL